MFDTVHGVVLRLYRSTLSINLQSKEHSMGGGGSYYDRDVASSRDTSSRGFSTVSERSFSATRANVAVLPKNRSLVSTCKTPVVSGFDHTGSMGDLPIIIRDKMPMVAGQLALHRYLIDSMVSIAAIGDVISDTDPIQVCDFAEIRKLDEQMKRICIERNGGGGQPYESYEFLAYFYARRYEMQNAVTPIFLITGDEMFRDSLSAAELTAHFGGEHRAADAFEIFGELKKKFNGNVFHLRRRYDSTSDREIAGLWRRALGEVNVIPLPEDKAVGDMMLGIFALASGARTLDEYVEDMRSRPLNLGGEKFEPQSPRRIEAVRAALEAFASTRKKRAERATVSESPTKSPVVKDMKSKKEKGVSGKDWKL
ncbi:MAG: hypothetical protein A3B29_05400 [Candidatus Sungbacteria bacterium RIFCSPLOWO2_01_FULL_51_34]|nr:MAG: hypothetical protein A3B29_05400 [Candidatus Sungbacteria bacterium RIFCSPLOWO2_01_FULL_51_34]